MEYSEELLWILDMPRSAFRNDDEMYQYSIDFVHSLGLKCDCVGWCKMSLSNPKAPEILKTIYEFCKENKCGARCYYTREYINVESDWYELVTTDFKENTTSDRHEILSENSEEIYTRIIRAYHEMSPSPKSYSDEIYVPERFRNFCIQNNIDDLDFCWAQDKGKYEAEQYFHVFGKRLIPRVAVDYCFKKKNNKKYIAAAGGWLPILDHIFYEFGYISLPDCYMAEDLPDNGIVYVHSPSPFNCIHKNTILIHKDIAQALIQQKIVPGSALRPAPVVNELPGGYMLLKTRPIERPTRQFMDMMLSGYEKIKKTNRPIRMVSEKDALKILRIAKRERKEDFSKALPKAKAESLADTEYSPLIPYYCVTNGGFLSDEYEFLSSSEATIENEEFQKELACEELIDTKHSGIVIAKCPDGDVILLCNNSEVIRFSHEVPESTEQWPSLAQFFVDTIND